MFSKIFVLQPDSPDLPSIMRENVSFQMKNGNPQQAAKMLEKLRRCDNKI